MPHCDVSSKNPAAIAGMFDRVAKRYSLMNTLLSLGQDRRWRRETVKAIGIQPGDEVLDLGCGAGSSSLAVAKKKAWVTGLDISPRMLDIAKKRHINRANITWQLGEGVTLPFADGVFDAVLTVFALRNMPDILKQLKEISRVLKPGGKLAICEFSHPAHPFFKKPYALYGRYCMSPLARRFSSDPKAYDYLQESIADWPKAAKLAELMQESGYRRVRWRYFTGGVVAIHLGVWGTGCLP